MNNIIQKGGLRQKELAKQLIIKFNQDHGGLRHPNFIKVVSDWIDIQIRIDATNGELIHNADYCKIGPESLKASYGEKHSTMSESDFYSGFNTDLELVISQTITLENLFIEAGNEGLKQRWFNKHIVAVDGVNIIHNIDILIGFLPLIIARSPNYINDVLIFINSIIKANKLIHKYNGPSLAYINHEKMKIVLQNVLPLIIDNINLSYITDIMIFQHDSDPLQHDQKAVTHTFEHYNLHMEQSMKQIIFIKIPKVTETGSSIPIPITPAIVTELPYQTKTTNRAIVMAPNRTLKPSFIINNTTQFDGMPQFVTHSENDDAALIAMALYYNKILQHQNFSIFSGDKYKQVIMEGVVNKHVRLVQADSTDPFQIIEFVPIEVTEATQSLDKQIFDLSVIRLDVIENFMHTVLISHNLNPLLTDDIYTYIDEKRQKMGAPHRPAPPTRSSVPAPPTWSSVSANPWQAKYIKYKQKYLLLKSQYN